MRIFTAVRHSIDPRHFYGGLWSGNFYPALRRLGHELVESQVDLQPASRFMQAVDFNAEQRQIRAQISERIVEEIRAAHQKSPLDVCLFYFYNSHFEPEAFDAIHALGVPTINFFCNSIYQFELVASIARKATYSWHAERDARSKYLEIGANPVWVQMAADPEIYHPVSGLARKPKAVFVGMNYADRAEWMAALLRGQVPVDIVGRGWAPERSGASNGSQTLPAQGPSPGSLSSYLAAARQCLEREGWAAPARLVRQWADRQRRRQLMPLFAPYAQGWRPFTEIAEIFSSYEVCLNFSNVWSDGRPGSSLVPHVRLRDFEGPMSRTCYLTGHTSEIEEFYRIGEEIDTYTSETELVEKAKFYLAHPERAERLREAGYQRARRDHTWERRFEELFQKTDLATHVGNGT